MYKILAAALVMAAGLAIYSTAQAVGGCGWGYHRGPHGGCRVNRSDAPAPRPAVVVAGPRTVIYAPLGRACPVGHHLSLIHI